MIKTAVFAFHSLPIFSISSQMVCKWDRVIKSTPYMNLKAPSNSVYLHKSIVFVWFISLEAGFVCVLFIRCLSELLTMKKKNIKSSVIYHEQISPTQRLPCMYTEFITANSINDYTLANWLIMKYSV